MRIDRISGIIFLIALISFFAYKIISIKKEDIKIEKKGLYTFAKVVDRIATKGNIRRLDYTFLINSFNGSSYVSNVFYRNVKIGDTIIIQFLNNDFNSSKIIETKYYRKCMFKKMKIWKNIPTCD